MAAGKLGQKAAEDLYRRAQSRRSSFIAELTGSGAVSPADLAHTLSAAFGVPLLDLDAVDTQRLPRGLLDAKTCQAFRVVVLARRSNRLTVATADPSDQQAAEKIKFATQMGVDWIIAEYDKLTRMVEANATTAAEAMDNIIGEDFQFDESTFDSAMADDEDKGLNAEVDDAPVVKFLHKMLLDAFSQRASDIHFEPYEHNYRVRFRIDGELREMAAPPVAIKDKLASRIKVISRMDISEKRVPQDGRMTARVHGEVFDVRVSILPGTHGESVVMRLLRQDRPNYNLGDLGMFADHANQFQQWVETPNGIVLVTGPTGSGKTTQLPKICLELGRGLDKMIGHTQPRRLAASSVARRIAEELNSDLGQWVYCNRSTGSGYNTTVPGCNNGVIKWRAC